MGVAEVGAEEQQHYGSDDAGGVCSYSREFVEISGGEEGRGVRRLLYRERPFDERLPDSQSVGWRDVIEFAQVRVQLFTEAGIETAKHRIEVRDGRRGLSDPRALKDLTAFVHGIGEECIRLAGLRYILLKSSMSLLPFGRFAP